MTVFSLLVLVLNKRNYNHTKKVNPIQSCVAFRVDEQFPPRRQVFVTFFSPEGSQNGFRAKLTKPRDSYLKFVCAPAWGGVWIFFASSEQGGTLDAPSITWCGHFLSIMYITLSFKHYVLATRRHFFAIQTLVYNSPTSIFYYYPTNTTF